MHFLWRGRGIGAWLMKLSLSIGFLGIILGMINPRWLYVTKQEFFWLVIIFWCVGKIINHVQKRWCPEEDSNLHEENFTRT